MTNEMTLEYALSSDIDDVLSAQNSTAVQDMMDEHEPGPVKVLTEAEIAAYVATQ